MEFLTAEEITAGRAEPVTPDSLMAFRRLMEPPDRSGTR